MLSFHISRLPKVPFPVGLPFKILKPLLLFSILATFPAHLNLIDLLLLVGYLTSQIEEHLGKQRIYEREVN